MKGFQSREPRAGARPGGWGAAPQGGAVNGLPAMAVWVISAVLPSGWTGKGLDAPRPARGPLGRPPARWACIAGRQAVRCKHHVSADCAGPTSRWGGKEYCPLHLLG